MWGNGRICLAPSGHLSNRCDPCQLHGASCTGRALNSKPRCQTTKLHQPKRNHEHNCVTSTASAITIDHRDPTLGARRGLAAAAARGASPAAARTAAAASNSSGPIAAAHLHTAMSYCRFHGAACAGRGRSGQPNVVAQAPLLPARASIVRSRREYPKGLDLA